MYGTGSYCLAETEWTVVISFFLLWILNITFIISFYNIIYMIIHGFVMSGGIFSPTAVTGIAGCIGVWVVVWMPGKCKVTTKCVSCRIFTHKRLNY